MAAYQRHTPPLRKEMLSKVAEFLALFSSVKPCLPSFPANIGQNRFKTVLKGFRYDQNQVTKTSMSAVINECCKSHYTKTTVPEALSHWVSYPRSQHRSCLLLIYVICCNLCLALLKSQRSRNIYSYLFAQVL